jgi:hypothetical protein
MHGGVLGHEHGVVQREADFVRSGGRVYEELDGVDRLRTSPPQEEASSSGSPSSQLIVRPSRLPARRSARKTAGRTSSLVRGLNSKTVARLSRAL